MGKLIGYCGMDCEACPALKATRANDDELRTRTAAEWSEQFKAEIKPEHINCTGCTGDGPHIMHWDECGIRKCAQEKSVANCAHCPDYCCEQLDKFLEMVPPARANLEEVRAGL